MIPNELLCMIRNRPLDKALLFRKKGILISFESNGIFT
jgi:hypothetical protein